MLAESKRPRDEKKYTILNIRRGKDRNVFVICVSKLRHIFGTQITTDKFAFFIGVDSRCRVCYLLRKKKSDYHYTGVHRTGRMYDTEELAVLPCVIDLILLFYYVLANIPQICRPFVYVFKRLSRTLRNRKPERYLRGTRVYRL